MCRYVAFFKDVFCETLEVGCFLDCFYLLWTKCVKQIYKWLKPTWFFLGGLFKSHQTYKNQGPLFSIAAPVH